MGNGRASLAPAHKSRIYSQFLFDYATPAGFERLEMRCVKWRWIRQSFDKRLVPGQRGVAKDGLRELTSFTR